MQVLIFLSLVALAVGSLEPSGYQPPGSSSLSSRYLPPNELRPPIAVPSSQYLPSSSSSSSANRYTNSQNVIPTSQYLPPSPSERQNSAPSLLPASTYLPSNRQSVVIPTLPSANYLPAVVNRQTTSPFSPTMSPFSPSTTRISQSLTHGVVGTPSNVYLPGDRITRFGQGGSSSSSSSSFGKSFASGSIPSLTTSPLAKAPSSQYLPSNQFGNSQNFGYDYNAIEVTVSVFIMNCIFYFIRFSFLIIVLSLSLLFAFLICLLNSIFSKFEWKKKLNLYLSKRDIKVIRV